MLNTVPTYKSAILKLFKPYKSNVKIEKTANGNIAYVSLLKQLENSSTLFWTHFCQFFVLFFFCRFDQLYTLPMHEFVKIR